MRIVPSSHRDYLFVRVARVRACVREVVVGDYLAIIIFARACECVNAADAADATKHHTTSACIPAVWRACVAWGPHNVIITVAFLFG